MEAVSLVAVFVEHEGVKAPRHEATQRKLLLHTHQTKEFEGGFRLNCARLQEFVIAKERGRLRLSSDSLPAD